MYLNDYRELIKNLVISDLKLKYASSVLGFAWSLINPLLMMIVLYYVFRNVFSPSNSGPEYALSLLIGLFAWRFFSTGTSAALYSIVGKSSLVTKIFIPRHILTLSNVLANLISSLLEFVVLIIIIYIFGYNFSLTFLLFPFIHILLFLNIYGAALILSSLYVYFRDLNQIWDVLLQIGFFMSPIVYPVSLIPQNFMFFYMLNPITRLMGMYRDIFLNNAFPGLMDTIVVLTSGLLLIAVGTVIFNKLSLRFAEEV